MPGVIIFGGAGMESSRPIALATLLMATLLAGCGLGQDRKEFERQLEVCAAGVRNGVLDAAAEGCGGALDIAKENDYPAADISDLSYRLGRIERQRGEFEMSEGLLRESLDFETQSDDAAGIASRLVELSLSLAGQGRWDEGAGLLDRAEPYLAYLEGAERKAAANTLRGYAARLGDSESASRFAALALELDAP